MLPQSLVDLLPPSASLVSPAATIASALPTGLQELDAVLGGGGLPRGRLTEVVGARGSGMATLLRRLVEETLGGSGWVAYIDATRTLAPRDWAHLGDGEGLWVVRPRDATRAAWCADVLLRCGAFALVIIDSAPPLSSAVAVRLTRLARETGAALVVAGDDEKRRESGGSRLGGAVRLRVQRGSPPTAVGVWRTERPPDDPPAFGGHPRVTRNAPRATTRPPSAGTRAQRVLAIVVEKGGGGTHRSVEVRCAIGVARRLCTHPEVPDRRGVARREAGRPGGGRPPAPASLPAGDGQPNDAGVGSRTLPRKRRCAEPDYGAGPSVGRRAAAARALG